jgi:L-iditol 2-dehydrogenase
VLDVLCHSAGASLTMIADLAPFRLETARKLGADYAVNVAHEDPVERVMEVTHGIGADCVIECVGHYHPIPGRETPLQQAVKMIRNGGRISESSPRRHPQEPSRLCPAERTPERGS